MVVEGEQPQGDNPLFPNPRLGNESEDSWRSLRRPPPQSPRVAQGGQVEDAGTVDGVVLDRPRIPPTPAEDGLGLVPTPPPEMVPGGGAAIPVSPLGPGGAASFPGLGGGGEDNNAQQEMLSVLQEILTAMQSMVNGQSDMVTAIEELRNSIESMGGLK